MPTDETEEKKSAHKAKAAAFQPPAGYSDELAWPPKYTIRWHNGRGHNVPCAMVSPSLMFDSEESAQGYAAELAIDMYNVPEYDCVRRVTRNYESAKYTQDVDYNEAVSPLSDRYRVWYQGLRDNLDAAVRPLNQAHARAKSAAMDVATVARGAAERRYTEARTQQNTPRVSRSEAVRRNDDARNIYYADMGKIESSYNAGLRQLERDYNLQVAQHRNLFSDAEGHLNSVYESLKAPFERAHQESVRVLEEKRSAGYRQFLKPFPIAWQDVQSAFVAEQTQVVFWRETFWLAAFHQDHSDKRLMFPCLCPKDETRGSVSFIANVKDGQRGKRTSMKIGRFLTANFSEQLTPKQISDLVTWQTTGSKPNEYCDESLYPLAFAATPDEIENVYVNGPRSCMSPPGSHFRDDVHPCRIYGVGDLQVAYLGKPDDSKKGLRQYIARALCWPEKKAYGRVYPTPGAGDDTGANRELQAALDIRLRQMGWTPYTADATVLDGARMFRVPVRGHGGRGYYIMPYIDGHRGVGVTADAKYFTIDQRGSFRGDDTGGYSCFSSAPPIPADAPRLSGAVYDNDAALTASLDGEDDDDTWACDRCDDEYGADIDGVRVATRLTDNGEGIWVASHWCACCVENHTFFCHGINEHISDDLDCVDVDGELHSARWAESHAHQSDLSGEWTMEDMREVLTCEGVRMWTEEEANDGSFVCPVTGFDTDNDFSSTDEETGDTVGDEFTSEQYEAYITRWRASRIQQAA